MTDSYHDQTVGELLGTYRDVLDELRRREVIRTDNAPTGDYAEYLVAKLYDGELAPNSEKSYDVADDDGQRLQVKARVTIDASPGTRQLSFIRSWGFDTLIVVLFTPRYAIHRAASVPVDVARERSRYVPHVNGHRLVANDALWDIDGVVDITGRMRQVAT